MKWLILKATAVTGVHFLYSQTNLSGINLDAGGARRVSYMDVANQRKPNQKKVRPILALRVPCASQYN